MFKSPVGEIFTCIFFATKTPPGIEWYGFSLENEERNDKLYFGLIDTNKKELGYFSLNDIKGFDAEYTTDPDVISNIHPPAGWKKYEPVQITEG